MACRRLLSRAVAGRRHSSGAIALYLSSLHRGDADFRALASEFCAQAGDDLLPICRDLLAECRSPATRWLVAAILGHSRRPDAFPLLKEFAEQTQGNAEQADAYASAVYSIGMLRTKEGQQYLLRLFSEAGAERRNVGTRFGTALTAAVGMCGKEGLALLREAARSELDPEMKPDTDEGLRVFRWSYLSLVDSPEAFEDLKTIATTEPDLRFRGMAIAALGQSSDPSQRVWLTGLYAQDKDPLIRRAILEALNDGAKSAPAEWTAMKEKMATPLATILSSTRLPSGNEYVDYAAIHLASSMDTAESKKLVDEWVRTASSGAYGEESFWLDIAIHALAAQRAGPDRIEALLQAAGLDESERIHQWTNFVNNASAPPSPPAMARELIAALDKGHEYYGGQLNAITALAKYPDARPDVEACLDRLIERAGSDSGERFRAYYAAASAGEAGLRPLAKIIRRAENLTDVVDASCNYLNALPQGRELEPDLHARFRGLFTPESSNQIAGPALAWAAGQYFARFGTSDDLPLLEAIPRLIPQADEKTRQSLEMECAKAADAIRLRSN